MFFNILLFNIFFIFNILYIFLLILKKIICFVNEKNNTKHLNLKRLKRNIKKTT